MQRGTPTLSLHTGKVTRKSLSVTDNSGNLNFLLEKTKHLLENLNYLRNIFVKYWIAGFVMS